jgi:hypothetical protein
MKGLILTYILALSATVAGFRYPALGLLGYVFFAVLRPHFLFGFAGEIASISDWIGTAMLIGWALNGFGSWRFGRARGVVIALFIFIGWFVLSATQAINPSLAFASIVPLSKFMLPVVMGLTLLEDAASRRRILWAIVLAQGYVGFEMNLEYLRGFNIAAEGFGGMDNNCFGAGLVATIGPAVALAIASRTWIERIAASAAAALILHTILLTFSRGAMVGMLAVGATAIIMMPKRPKNLAALAVALAIAIRFTGPQLAERYSSVFVSAEERDASAASRLDLWRDCLLVVSEFPIFGVGPANWRVISAQYGWPAGKSAHSVWMESAAEVGIPGALALLSFFGIAALKLWPIARRKVTPENRMDIAVANAGVLSAVGFIAAGQFVSVAGLEVPYYVVMVGAGLLKSESRKRATEAAAAPVPAPPQAYVPPALRPAPAGPAPVRGRLLALPHASRDTPPARPRTAGDPAR